LNMSHHIREFIELKLISYFKTLLLMTMGISIVRTASLTRNELIRVDLETHVPCGLWTCDLRQYYCDPVINGCARCDDDCHPARINGNRAAVEECQKNCAVYYKFSAIDRSLSTTSSPLGSSYAAVSSPTDQVQSDVTVMDDRRVLITLLVVIAVSTSCIAIAACIFVCVNLCRKCQRRPKHCECHGNAGEVPSTTQDDSMSPASQSTGRQLAKIHQPARKHSLDRTTRPPHGPIIIIGHSSDMNEHATMCVLEPLLQT